MFYYIHGINEGRAVPWSITDIGGIVQDPPEPSYEDCLNLVNTYANDNEPHFVCMLTGPGNVARVKVEQFNPLGSGVLAIEISFITWEQ